MKYRSFLFSLGLCAIAVPHALAFDTGDDYDGSAHRDHVKVMSSQVVTADETVAGDCVTVMGNAIVDGKVTHDCVTVMGNAVINGRVDHDVVAMGSLTLGPNAHVGHDAVCIGRLRRDPGAFIGHDLVNPWGGPFFVPPLYHAHLWWTYGLHRGQFLNLSPNLGWLWLMSLISLGMSVIVALIAPRQVHRAGDLLLNRPGLVILSAIVAVIGVPLALLLIACTLIGIPFLFFLAPAALILPLWFGRAALYSLFARRLMGEKTHPALAVLIGGLIVMAIYLLPFFGALCFLLVTFLAWGCAWAALLGGGWSRKAPAAALPPPPSPPTPTYSEPATAPSEGIGASAPGGAACLPRRSEAETGPRDAGPVEPEVAGSPAREHREPPPIPLLPERAASEPAVAPVLPRAGFWLRMGALAIDFILVLFASAILRQLTGAYHRGPSFILILLAAYSAILWKLRGTTIGGIICHLAVERIDGRPIDWPTAIVRALGCFVSLIVAGLGFLWIAFDDEHQSWHDKIAGTVVVVTPHRRSLV